MSTVKLFLVRHAETAWTRERRFTGWCDVPLTERGQAQAEAVARALASVQPSAVYASPLERARTTAEIIAKPHRLDVTASEAFREMGFGTWEGLTREEVERRFPDAFLAWRDAPHTLTAHQGELLSGVADRVAAGVEALEAAHPASTVIVVSHAVIIRLMVLRVLGLGPDRLWAVDASPAGITEVELAPGWASLHRMNTLAHLAELP